ncbi:hypothetical protein [Bradyrhizobium sp. USDA 4452]
METDDNMQTPVNDSATCADLRAPLTQPRSLSDLKTWLHSDRIRHPGDLARTTRESIIITAIDTYGEDPGFDQTFRLGLSMRRAAKELADLYPDLSWLPSWKPRVAVIAGGER